MNGKEPIGILDSGVGGLTVWREIVRILPSESTIYYADTAHCPYGTKSYSEIIDLTEKCVEELISRRVKMVVIACNTITAASISLLRTKYPDMLFVGMEPAIKPAVKMTRSGIIGILATKATLAGELYHKTASNLPREVKIIETAGTGLVELIEQGLENSPESEILTRKYIMPMIEQGADCIVLGCTHYPLLTDTINRISNSKLTIINPAPAVAKRVKFLLETNNLLNSPEVNSAENSAANTVDNSLLYSLSDTNLIHDSNILRGVNSTHIFLSSAGDTASLEVTKRAMDILHSS